MGGRAGDAGGRGPGAGGGGRGGQPVSSGYNLIFVGSKGYLGTSGRGEGVGLLPGSRWAEYKLPNAYLQRSPGASTGDNGSAHARDWVRACKGGAPACSSSAVNPLNHNQTIRLIRHVSPLGGSLKPQSPVLRI